MHRLRPVFAVAVCALFLQFGDAKSVPPQSSATQQESEGPEKIPPEDVNRPKQIIGMETTSSFKESIDVFRGDFFRTFGFLLGRA